MQGVDKAAMKALWELYDGKKKPPKTWTEIKTTFIYEGEKYEVKAMVKDGTDGPIATNVHTAGLKVRKK